MEEQRQDGINDLELLVKEGTDQELREFLRLIHPADIADLVEELEEAGRARIFQLIPRKIAADVLPEIEDHIFDEVMEAVSAERLADFVGEMDTDDAADLLAELPSGTVRTILARIDASDSAEIKQLLGYGEDTAGGLMQTELIAVVADARVVEVIDSIRKQKDEVENVHFVYVVDAGKKLRGVLELRDLLLADNHQMVSEIMDPEVLSARVSMDQEAVAAIFQKYDLVALPVVDDTGRLVGRIVVDDVLDVMEEEMDEDVLRMAGAGDEELEERSVFKSVQARLPWLFITGIGGIGTGMVIGHFSTILHNLILLTTFIPVVMAMGGNVGTQSATIVVRGMATGRIDYRKIGGFLLGQVAVGATLGAVMGATLAIFVDLKHDALDLGLVTGFALLSAMSFAAGIGTFMPVVFKRLGIDPAVATAPFISMFCDIMGIFIYLSLASALIS